MLSIYLRITHKFEYLAMSITYIVQKYVPKGFLRAEITLQK